MTSTLPQLVSSAVREILTALRRDLHQRPELSFEEQHTAQRLYKELEALEPLALERVAGTGVVARLKGRDSDAPTVAIRGDIDALPIQEATGLPFASEVPDVMHACGHDVHATWAVGAAHLLVSEPAAGDVLIVLQPAEETGRGAPAVLKTGILDGVAAIFGGHVDLRFQVGEVVADAGPLAAAADVFRVELVGSGGHGALPHETHDPIVGAAALITALQTIVSRRLNPADAAVVTVGTLQAGTAPNVIPDLAHLSGTTRAVAPDVRRALHQEIERLSNDVARAHRLSANVTFELGPPPIVNESPPIEWARTATRRVLGEHALKPLGFLNMAGEDFACYLESIPGCFLRIGAQPANGEVIAAHTPRFHPAEESIFVGAAVLAETARVASAALCAE